MKNSVICIVCLLLCAIIVYDQAEATTGHVKNSIKHGLMTLKGKLMMLRVPFPVHVLKEHIHHHTPVPFHDSFYPGIGYGFEHRGRVGLGDHEDIYGGGYGDW